MQGFKMLIDGKLVDAESGLTYAAINPATEEEIARVPLGDKADVDKAVAAAKRAFPAWSHKPAMERARIFNQVADICSKYAEEIGKLECLDHGFPLKMGMPNGAMPGFMFRSINDSLKNLVGTTASKRSNALIYMQWEPIGVCGLITPWNFPLMMAMSKLGPCLASGNTCVLKPPSIDSLSVLKLAEALQQSDLPPGVVNVVTGPGNTVGEAIASHPDVWMIGFTGSSETGKRIMALGSVNVKHLALELGGKNPFIVFPDADLDTAVETGVRACMRNCGQICAAPGRFYLHEKIHDQFVEMFISACKKIVVGDPMDAKTQMGPVVSREHRDKIEGYIKSGVDEGAKLILGGQRPTTPPLDKGYYVLPTVFTGVTQQMKIAREEIFGPVACIMEPFSTEADVIARANDNTYGLSAVVFTKDATRAMRIANELEVGDVWINEHQLADGMPWHGIKESGLGNEGGNVGIMEYNQLKAYYVDLTGLSHRPWNEL